LKNKISESLRWMTGPDLIILTTIAEEKLCDGELVVTKKGKIKDDISMCNLSSSKILTQTSTMHLRILWLYVCRVLGRSLSVGCLVFPIIYSCHLFFYFILRHIFLNLLLLLYCYIYQLILSNKKLSQFIVNLVFLFLIFLLE